MKTPLAHALVCSTALVTTIVLVACTGGGGGSSDAGAQGGFLLTNISVPEGAIWEINRAVELTFNQDVDFRTIGMNTINVQTASGVPASGAFYAKGIDADGDGVEEATDARVVVFQPTCPTLPDLSDAGLHPGSTPYVLSVPGISSGADHTVRSLSGAKLRSSQTRRFTTPASNDPADAFIDTVIGPPRVLVRGSGSNEANASHVEFGLAGERVYFEFDAATQTYALSEAEFAAPLNLFSNPGSHLSVALYFDQPVSPDEDNITPRLLQLEFLDRELRWQPLATRVELVANCTRTGALVRLEPIGILPAGSRFRTVVRAGFRDLVEDAHLLGEDDFGEIPTTSVAFTSLFPATDLGDEVLAEFDHGGADANSLEDHDALFETPKAEWADGRLTMAFDFDGTGGPNGTFDWIVRTGETFLFDTSASSIDGGPNGLHTTTQNTVGGFVNVRHLTVEAGGRIRVQGPNVMTISATGTVRIDGTIDVSGLNAKDVSSLDTGHQPEVGGAGMGGGGKGGTGSWVTTSSTPFGGAGWGMFGAANGGAVGGESGYENTNKQLRRPGGGGGGALGRPQFHFPLDALLQAEPGHDGAAASTGAMSGRSPAAGGAPGLGGFLDGDDTNDFFGVLPAGDGVFIRGEAQGMLAGAGGGAGGDALPSLSFPTPGWTKQSDEKGGGGGGGAGGINIRALGPILFGDAGTLVCDGGRGGTGENVINFDHIGGSGGSGSGGHVVLETASHIAFGEGPSAPDRFYVTAAGGPWVVGDTRWMTGPDGTYPSNGGPGGPGVVQLHVPRPLLPPGIDSSTSDIVMSALAATDDHPLQKVAVPGALVMVPLFGATSQARSRWISIGGADQDPDEGVTLLDFLFAGTDALVDGRVLTTEGKVDELPPLLAEDITDSPTVSVVEDGATLVIEGSSLSPLIDGDGQSDLYLRTPALLEKFIVRLTRADDSRIIQDFAVSWAEYDDEEVALTLAVDATQGTLAGFIEEAGSSAVSYELIPRFFRVQTGDQWDVLPDSARVKITFDAAGADAFGNPADDPDELLIDRATDVTAFDYLSPGELRFFRFHVEFELDGLDVNTELVGLDFLRLPFRF